jgi:hypothetical protein
MARAPNAWILIHLSFFICCNFAAAGRKRDPNPSLSRLLRQPGGTPFNRCFNLLQDDTGMIFNGEHRTLGVNLSPERILRTTEDVDTFKSNDLKNLGKNDLPILRRSVFRTTYLHNGYKIHRLEPRTLSGFPQKLDPVLKEMGLGNWTELGEGITDIDKRLRDGTLTPEQIEKISNAAIDLQKSESETYLKEVKELLAPGDHTMRVRRGYDTTELMRLAPELLQRSSFIVIENEAGEVVIAFRSIAAPYGVKQEHGFFGPKEYGRFGPAVMAHDLSAEDINFFPEWLFSYPDLDYFVRSPFVNILGYTPIEYPQRAPYIRNLIEKFHAEAKAGPISLLMMETILKDVLRKMYPDGRLPRPFETYLFDGKGAENRFGSGVIYEWGAFYIKKGTPPEIALDLMTNTIQLLFNESLDNHFTTHATRIYTYGGPISEALFSLFGFKIFNPQAFQNPLSVEPEDWHILSATPQDILASYYRYHRPGSQGQEKTARAIIREFIERNKIDPVLDTLSQFP